MGPANCVDCKGCYPIERNTWSDVKAHKPWKEPRTSYLVQTIALCLLYHADTFTHLARILNHAICISPPDAFHRHLADGLRAQFPDYPCLAHSPGNNPNLQQLLYVVSCTYATHAAYLKPPVLSLPEAWCFTSVILTWSYTAALLLPPLRQRLTPSMQLAWLSANVMNDMLIPPLAWGLFRGAPPSFVRHYLPTTIEALAYVGFIGLPAWFIHATAALGTLTLWMNTRLLIQHGLTDQLPYRLSGLWIRHACTIIAVVAFTAMRPHIWRAVLWLLSPPQLEARSAVVAAAADAQQPPPAAEQLGFYMDDFPPPQMVVASSVNLRHRAQKQQKKPEKLPPPQSRAEALGSAATADFRAAIVSLQRAERGFRCAGDDDGGLEITAQSRVDVLKGACPLIGNAELMQTTACPGLRKSGAAILCDLAVCVEPSLAGGEETQRAGENTTGAATVAGINTKHNSRFNGSSGESGRSDEDLQDGDSTTGGYRSDDGGLSLCSDGRRCNTSAGRDGTSFQPSSPLQWHQHLRKVPAELASPSRNPLSTLLSMQCAVPSAVTVPPAKTADVAAADVQDALKSVDKLRAMIAAARAAPYSPDPSIQLTSVQILLPGVTTADLGPMWREAALQRLNRALTLDWSLLSVGARHNSFGTYESGTDTLRQ